jgi:hypothetical protein
MWVYASSTGTRRQIFIGETAFFPLQPEDAMISYNPDATGCARETARANQVREGELGGVANEDLQLVSTVAVGRSSAVSVACSRVRTLCACMRSVGRVREHGLCTLYQSSAGGRGVDAFDVRRRRSLDVAGQDRAAADGSASVAWACGFHSACRRRSSVGRCGGDVAARS